MKQPKKTAPVSSPAQKEQAFFIAANGYSGFRSRYDSVFHSLSFSHIYVIKGGPGTGKSSMMKEIARAVEARGGTAEYIYCSSDPDSLDGIILASGKKRIAVLDGTAPHTRDTDYPGVIDEIANLGEFWNSDCLAEQKEEVLRLCREKTSDYQMAYRYLALAGSIDCLLTDLLSRCLNRGKMQKSIGRIIRELTPSRAPKERTEYWSACSMKGKIRLSPALENATVINIDSYLGSGRFYLNALRDALRAAGRFSYLIIPSCYTDERTEGVYLPDDNLLFIEGKGPTNEKTINMRRFLLPDITRALRPKMRQLATLHECMTDTAVSYLREAGAYHFALEEIYGNAMDFKAKEAYSKKLIARILKQLFPAEKAN